MVKKLLVAGGVRDLVFGDIREVVSAEAYDVLLAAYPDARYDVSERRAGALLVLTAARGIEGELTALIDEAVGVARASGASWQQVGAALGVSRQAATKRFQGGRVQW